MGGRKGGHARDDPQRPLREHLAALLRGGGAHLSFDEAVADLPPPLRGARPLGLPHTPWRLLEHMRLAQQDILEFTRSADWESPPWPEGYWPRGDGPPDDRAWRRSIEQFEADLEAMVALVRDAGTDLFAPLPWGTGQTPLREALLIADHNSYHLGQLVTVRRLLGAWHD
ncbi:MAG: DinB family protein [Phycisphaeraceae bacterium]